MGRTLLPAIGLGVVMAAGGMLLRIPGPAGAGFLMFSGFMFGSAVKRG